MTTILIVSTILIALLSLALWHCYKTNKPLREEARKKAEEKAKQEAREIQRQLEESRKQETRENTFADLDWALRDPERHFHGGYRQNGSERTKYSELAEVLRNAKNLKTAYANIADLSTRSYEQSKLIHNQRSQIKALQANIEDIKQALQMGTPVEL